MSPTVTTTSVEESQKAKLKEAAHQLGERVRPKLEKGKRQLQSLGGRAKELVNEHPAACLMAALALGYVAARVVRAASDRR